MNIVLFAHPDFLGQQSMPRFLQMLYNGFTERGHTVSILKPTPLFLKIPFPKSKKKWLGYIDQYLVFPLKARKVINSCTRNTLFVFTDHALGPWVPLTVKRYRVVHCHDFLAQRSAKGEFAANPTGFTGKLYQKYIKRGYNLGENFISVSNKTRQDLEEFLSQPCHLSEVVYNGLNQVCTPTPARDAQTELGETTKIDLSKGYFLHVGGNDWYKNRVGVIEMYNAWRSSSGGELPLLLIGAAPNEAILAVFEKSPFKDKIHFLTGLLDNYVRLAYSGATALLFPSLAEGFGWPIAEAMACACPVITTGEAPMNEVAGKAAYFISRRPDDEDAVPGWAYDSARVMEVVATLPAEKRKEVINKGLENAKRFDTKAALDKIEQIYFSILEQ